MSKVTEKLPGYLAPSDETLETARRMAKILNLLGIRYSFMTCTAQPTLLTFSEQATPETHYLVNVAGKYFALHHTTLIDDEGLACPISEHPNRLNGVSHCFIIGNTALQFPGDAA
jgi:hypothetical protein